MPIPIEALSAPFPVEKVKQRKGNFGQMLDYIDAPSVIARLNDVLDEWSFSIISHTIDPDEVIVKGRLQIGESFHEQFGGSSITRKKDTGEIVSIANDLKAATADCLKKCASSFGVGLYLYGGKVPESNGNGNGNGHVSNREITELFGVCRSNGVPQSQVIKAAKETYQKTISQLSSAESKELIEQLTRRRDYATV